MKKIFSIFLILVIPMVCSNAQSTKIGKADRYFQEGAYFHAISLYESVLKNEKNLPALTRLADCYRLTNNTREAEKLYAQVVKSKASKAVDKFYYAQMLQSNGKCLEARKWFNIYYNLDKSDKRALQLASSCDSLRFFHPDSSKVKVKKLAEINSTESDFGATLFQDGVVFTSSRYSGNGNHKISGRDGSPFLNMYYCDLDRNNQFGEISLFHGNLNSKLHDGPACFTTDFKKIFFTRNIKKKGVVRLHIFQADLAGEDWENIEALSFNTDKNSYGHPTISVDGKTLYFTSDKAGSGGTDIFMCKKNGEKWGAVRNLGTKINTRGNEMFPYLSKTGDLYFASNGHAGLGGLDIFKATFDEEGNCTSVYNMGAPVNSTFDDFALTEGAQAYTGYFSSNRPGGMGSDDIYQFQDLTDIKIIKYGIEGTIVKKETAKDDEQPVQGAVISLLDESKNELSRKVTKEDGRFQFDVESEKDYTLFIQKENHFTKRQSFSTTGKSRKADQKDSAVVKIKLEESVKVRVKEVVLNQENIIPNIYYDYNKANIRMDAARELDKVVQLLEDNPKLVIEIGAHTDTRGNDHINQSLSEKRAIAVRNYLVSKGIPSDRISARGYGKTRPLIPHANSERDHAMNRRTEFTVMQIRQ